MLFCFKIFSCLVGTGRILAAFLTLLVWSVMVATVHFSVVFKPRDILAMIADTTITDQNMELGLGRGLAFLPAAIIVLAKLIGKLDKAKHT